MRTDSMSTLSQPADVRRSIKDAVESTDAPQRDDVIESVADTLGVPTETVSTRLDEMEKHGFVYLVNGTVKIP